MTTDYHDWIAHHAEARGDRIAMVDLATNRRISYALFHQRIDRLAAALRARYAIAPGDRIGVLAHNSSDTFEIQFACARLGAIFVPMNWRLTVPELSFIVGDCAPVVLFHDLDFQEAAIQLAERCNVPNLLCHDTQYEPLLESGGDPVTPPALTFDDTATILYTSGTTGHPKGARITYGMRFWQAFNCTGPMRLGADTVTLVTLPLFHVGGLDVYANPVFLYGGTALVMKGYDPALTLRLLCDPQADVSAYIGAPAHFLFMAQLPEFQTAVFNPRLLACIAAAPVPIPQLRQWEERGLPLQQAWGMTETCGVAIALDPEDRVRKAGSAGKPCAYAKFRIVRTDGTDAGTDEMGELWVKGPSVTPGYWKNDDANRNAFTEGWLHTGDAALRDDEGFLYVVDRWKDMYISGGENVYPAEVEEVLFKLDGIAEVAIIGVPDDRWGEVGRAIIALTPDATLTEADIIRHCNENLARYKQPRSIVFVEALPRNATGKVHKPTLRQMHGTA